MKEYIINEDQIEDEFTVTNGELIRCKDCRWYMRSVLKGDYTEDMRYKPNYCMWWDSFTKEHDYCSRAERKEE